MQNDKATVDGALHMLEGILSGIGVDDTINVKEMVALTNWRDAHRDMMGVHPFCELKLFLDKITADGVLDRDETEDLKWFLGQLCSERNHYDGVSANIKRLDGLLRGIVADGEINDAEIGMLKQWLRDNERLGGIYPYDELTSLLIHLTKDGSPTGEAREQLLGFIRGYLEIGCAGSPIQV